MSLIERVGGIEAARSIVRGAPEGADYFAIVEELYYKCGKPFMIWAGKAWVADHCVNRVQSILEPINLNELRQRIESQINLEVLMNTGRTILCQLECEGNSIGSGEI